jgi:hypothetical protein
MFTILSHSIVILKILLMIHTMLLLLVGMVWVGVGFRFENPHQAGLGFSGGEWVGVGFTVGF